MFSFPLVGGLVVKWGLHTTYNFRNQLVFPVAGGLLGLGVSISEEWQQKVLSHLKASKVSSRVEQPSLGSPEIRWGCVALFF